MSQALDKAETGRSASLVCILVGIALTAGCLINPSGVYEPWAFYCAASVIFTALSVAAFALFHARVAAARAASTPLDRQ